MKKLLAFCSLFTSLVAFAQMSPLGTWHTIDDETGKPSGEIRIFDKGDGVLAGVVVRSLAPSSEGEEPNCTLCADDRKDKPKIGMEIIRGAKQTAGTDLWEGGTILDPGKGKIYKLRMMPQNGGKKLQIRGYIGPFFRSQTWNRVN